MPDSTLDPIYRPLMRAPSIHLDHCAVCGRPYPLEQHHFVWRSWGKVFRQGVEVPKPTITLCGFGNNLGSDGRYYCHGLAHHRMLHFRWVPAPPQFKEDDGYASHGGGRLEYLRTSEPTRYADALEMSGWREIAT